MRPFALNVVHLWPGTGNHRVKPIRFVPNPLQAFTEGRFRLKVVAILNCQFFHRIGIGPESFCPFPLEGLLFQLVEEPQLSLPDTLAFPTLAHLQLSSLPILECHLTLMLLFGGLGDN